MSKGINKVILVGNVGQDPASRPLPSGSTVCNISVATSRKWKDKQTNEWKDETEWHRVVMFGKLGEIAGEYLRKGSQVYIEGRLKTSQWEKDGQKHYTTEVIADEMQMLGGKEAGKPPQQAPQSDFDSDSVPF